jgi:hypothetical protein
MRLRLRQATGHAAPSSNGHAAATNGHAVNGHSNGHGTLPLTTSQLTSDIASTRAEINSLASERASLALASLTGDESARLRIIEIDAERSQLVSSLETIEAGLRALQLEKRTTGWRDRLDHFRKCTNSELRSVFPSFETNIKLALLDRTSTGYSTLQALLDELDVVELATAQRTVDMLMPEPRVFVTAGDQAGIVRGREERAQLLETRKANVAAAAQEIVSMGLIKRPPELVALMQQAQERLKVQPSPSQGLRT